MIKGTSTRKTSALFALVAGVVFLAASGRAFASSVICVPTQVEFFSQNGSPKLYINCNSNNYVVYTTAPTGNGCSSADNQNIDAMKTMASFAQAAFMSGKNLTIYYDGNSAYNSCVYDLVLHN